MNNFLSYKLQDPDLEANFCKKKLSGDKFQLLVIVGLTWGAIAGFIVVDFHVLKDSTILMISVLGRCLTIATSLILLFFSYRTNETKYFYLYTFLITITVYLNIIMVNAIESSTQITIVAWDIVAIFTCYAVVPVSLELQIISTTFLIIGSSFAWFVIKGTSWSAFEIVAILSAYLYANISGIFISRHMSISSRQAFHFLHEEKVTNAKLKDAISEIKTLQGILPMCSYCKKIRNDKGYWDQLENYLTENTDARLSHGMCPDCLKKERPAIYNRLLKKGKIPPSEER